jgi:RNA polymerase sigma-70 factor (ECF subfamily)
MFFARPARGAVRPETTAEFAELLARARAGDSVAVARLVEQYEPKVRVVARVLLGPALRPYLDSVDVVQSVHRSVIVGLRGGKFELAGPAGLVALAVTVLRRKVARQWRHLRKQQRLSLGDQAGQGEAPADPLDARAGADPDPAGEAAFRDAAGRLYEQLTETEQQMIELRLQGYRTDEIAARLGLHPVALRVRFTRLRKRLEESGVPTDQL